MDNAVNLSNVRLHPRRIWAHFGILIWFRQKTKTKRPDRNLGPIIKGTTTFPRVDIIKSIRFVLEKNRETLKFVVRFLGRIPRANILLCDRQRFVVSILIEPT